MRLFSKVRDHRYCAFCKVLRRVYVKQHIDLTNVLAAFALSSAVTFSYWGTVDPRGILLFGLILCISEACVYVRWRLSIPCKLCGFDAVLYKRSPALAARQVKEFFREQVENPEFWLTRSPLLQVQRRILEHQRKTAELDRVTKRPSASSSELVAPPPSP